MMGPYGLYKAGKEVAAIVAPSRAYKLIARLPDNIALADDNCRLAPEITGGSEWLLTHCSQAGKYTGA